MGTGIEGNAAPLDVFKDVTQLLLQLAQWGDIYPFLLEEGHTPGLANREKQSKRALVDLFTFTVAMLVYRRSFLDDEPYTLRSLAKALDGEDFNSIKAMEKRLKLVFERVEVFELFHVYNGTHCGKRKCLRIDAGPRLNKFLTTKCFT